MNATGDVETAAEIYEGMRGRLVADGGGQTLPIQLAWRRTEDDSEEPFVNIDGEGHEVLLDEYGVDSLEELVEKRGLRQFDRHRLGKITRYQREDGYEYVLTIEVELLQRVEGVTELLAEGLITEYDDIPSLCEWRREHGDVFLGGTLNDADVEDRPWADDLREFIESLDNHEDGLEKRLKEAGEWVEPDNVVADGGVPETLEDLAGTCESCGDDVDPDRLIEGEWPGCHYRPAADGGIAWTDLTGFKRDMLEAIRRLDKESETTYGLAIKRELERVYGEEVNHGRLYPNLDDLVDAGLIEKRALDKRTNEYELTTEAKAMLEQRARHLADACGMEQPVADGGDQA
jgi:DNA-binding PadR family transcriptional regulator